ncbi:hypothetical protein RNZ50_07250 [Paracoccaceae bacterium Fryx2]|nr:hypothetical protein [Paracoccaceae bacterium Fryx2]
MKLKEAAAVSWAAAKQDWHKTNTKRLIMTPSTPLPIVDTFTKPYKAWRTRAPTAEEVVENQSAAQIKEELIACVSNAHSAADYMLKVQVDNALGNYVETALQTSGEYRCWQKAMPSKTPNAISKYQKDLTGSNLAEVSNEIGQHGSFLAHGQSMFHGGLWTGGSVVVTSRPLSTSLCPQVALRNAEFNAKAYDAGRLDLLVLRVAGLEVKAFVFKRNGTKLGHESEILLSSGVTLKLIAETLVRSDYPATKSNHPPKAISVYVLDVDVS